MPRKLRNSIMTSARKILRDELTECMNDIHADLVKSLSVSSSRAHPSPVGGPPGTRTGRLISAAKKRIESAGAGPSGRVVMRVLMDLRVAKYAHWLIEVYNRPYIEPLWEKWKPIVKARLAAAFKSK